MEREFIDELLQKAELKRTRPREQILALLIESTVHLTAEQVYFALKTKAQHMALATVYRSLAALEQGGILAKVEIDGKQSYYYSPGEHRHILLCTGCGKVILLHECPAAGLLRAVEQEYGFFVTGHTFEIVGLCPECQKNKMGKTIEAEV